MQFYFKNTVPFSVDTVFVVLFLSDFSERKGEQNRKMEVEKQYILFFGKGKCEKLYIGYKDRQRKNVRNVQKSIAK